MINQQDVANVKMVGYGDEKKAEEVSAELEQHEQNTAVHVSDNDRNTWNGKETPSGAQSKVNTHENKTDIHVTLTEKNQWSGKNGAWSTVTLLNGATQNTSYPFKYSIANNILWLRGAIATLPASGTIVAKFANAPTQIIDFVVPTIGSYGTARFSLNTAGELKFDGMTATDNTAVSRVSIMKSIPLW